MRFRDLGPLLVEVDGVEHPPPGPKPAALLAALLVHANRRVSVPALLEVLWGDRLTAKPEATLESHVWRLRRLLEPSRGRGVPPAVLLNDNSGYRLLVRPDQIDSARFEQLADETRSHAATADPAGLLARCEEALALWRGAPYEHVAEQPWVTPILARLEEIAAELRERRIDALLALGSTDRALSDVAGLIQESPFRERLWGQRVLGLYRTGRADEALQTYQRARSTLLAELGAEPGPELQELHRRVLDQDPALLLTPRAPVRGAPTTPVRAAAAADPGAGTVEVHLPARPEPLIGRRSDLESLGRLLATRRLVTIAGAAGCGKTRLAVEVAATVAGSFPDGVWFVDLGSVDQPALVLDVVVTAIGFAAPAVGSVLDALRSYTRDRRMLLVLDNAEHLLPAVADVVGAVHVAEGRCALLVTSREPLAAAGEVVWPLGPLPLTSPADVEPPDPDGVVPVVDATAASPAVELFVARAHAADPTLALDGEAWPVVTRICQALDGLPLALELAAARVRSATLAEIAEQVTVDASGLRRLGRDTADHRQSVRSAIEWSHRLLSTEEQLVHRRLSVLPGPFTRAAATAVVGADPASGTDVPEVLAMLAHRSLLVPGRSGRPGGPSLFSQLATVRGHAAHALAGHEETDATVRRRDAWVAGLLSARPRVSRAAGDWYDAVADSWPTVRATLQHLLVDAPSAAAGPLMSDLTMFWYYRAHTLEAARWLRLVLADPGTAPVDAALAHLTLVAHALLRGRSDLAGPQLDTALALAPGCPPERQVELAEVMGAVALAAEIQQAHDQVDRLRTGITGIARATGDADVRLVAEALELLPGPSAPAAGTARGAAALHEQGCAQDNLLAAWVAATAAARRADGPEEALRWTDRQAELQVLLGAQDSGILAESRAGLMVAAGQHRDAVRLFAAARLYLRRAGLTWPLMPDTRALMRRAHQALGAEAYDRAWNDGGRLPAQQLMAELRG